MALKNEFDELAKLSGLLFSEEEKNSLISDMKSMIAFASEISNTEAAKDENSFPEAFERRDLVSKSFDRDEILKNAPTAEDGYFKLPDKA